MNKEKVEEDARSMGRSCLGHSLPATTRNMGLIPNAMEIQWKV
jgi:hypothetical protein